MNPPVRLRLREEGDTAEADKMEESIHHLPESPPGEQIWFACPGGRPVLCVHRDVEALEGLEEAWRRLTPVRAAPFQTFSWNLAWYRTYAGKRFRPLVFELSDGGETVAILPCYLDGRAIRLAGDRICDYQDVISADGAAAAVLVQEVLAWISREIPGGHLRLEKLSSEGELYRLLQAPGQMPEDTLSFRKSFAPCPYADLRGGLAPYLASLPRKSRQDLRNSLHRLEREAPEARVSLFRDLEIRVDDLWRAATFHIAHFRKRGTSPFDDPRLIDFFGRIAKDPDVGFQLGFLSTRDELLAVDFGFVRGGRYYGYLTAFDPLFSRLSPGKCLLLLRIDRWVGEDGVHTLDFLSGDEPYKRAFTGENAYRVWSVRLLPPGLRNRALHFGLESDKRLRCLAKRALGRSEAVPG